MSIDCSLKSLTSPGSSEVLQSHNSLTFKLLKTVADFSQALATLHDNFGHELQMLVETFRKRNGELRKESLFQVWELFLQQVEVNSQQHGDISRNFQQTIGTGLIERIFHRKIQSKKIFAHRDRIETILLKSNELLMKCYNDYCHSYKLALTNPAQYMSDYIAAHNVYVHQLQATNGMIHAYQTRTLPKLLEELEECHLEISLSISSSLLDSSELVSEKSNEQASGYQVIASACRQANHKQDLAQFVKLAANLIASNGIHESPNQITNQHQGNADNLDNGNQSQGPDKTLLAQVVRYHQFQSPQADKSQPLDPKNMQLVPTFKNEIAPDLSQPPAQQQPQLEKECENLKEKIEKFEERIESLSKLLFRSKESRLNNKVNELQEELSQKRFELLVAQIHLSAVRSQLQLFEYNYRPLNYHPNLLATAAAVASIQPNGDGDEMQLLNGGQLGGTGSGNPLSRKTSSNNNNNNNNASSTGSSNSNQQINASQQPIGYRSKWIKAFKSLKESPSTTTTSTIASSSRFGDDQLQQDQLGQQQQGQNLQLQQSSSSSASANQQAENQHFFQEYTFKKIASCDVCKDFLRGHMRQGVKCKLCKISCHNDCQTMAHAKIKCQQPKIKLLRRQKSAGELEVNNNDTDNNENANERTVNSKPDGIYQLIRQVLEAKKKGSSNQQQQQQQQHDHFLKPDYINQNSNAMMLLSFNQNLANQSGKSVSTSALGSTALNASVDRWAVVMDLLAESRKKDKEGDLSDASGMGAASSGKRHSKQLDKFKLAAKSAAQVSKYQRHYMQQQQQQPSPSKQPQAQQQPEPIENQSAALQQYQDQTPGYNQAPVSYQLITPEDMVNQIEPNQPASYHLSSLADQPQQQGLSLHHTKSLPVGKKLPQTGVNAASAMSGHHHQLHHQQIQHQQLLADSGHLMGANQQSNLVGLVHAPGPSGAMPYVQQQQLLNIGSQQLQSTSAPHSPQRKRFNLRMKSFSLDSPESPSVMIAGPPTLSSTGAAGSTPSANQQHQQQQVIQYQQQQSGAAGPDNSSGSAREAGQHYADQYYQQQQQHQESYQQQNYLYQQQAYEDSQLMAYLSANQSLGRHSSAGQHQPMYQHRHSYHNPSTNFDQLQQQQQQQQQRYLGDSMTNHHGNPHSSSHNALDLVHLSQFHQLSAGPTNRARASGSSGNGLNALGTGQLDSKKISSSDNLVTNSGGSNKLGNSAGKASGGNTNSSANISGSSPSAAAASSNSTNDYYHLNLDNSKSSTSHLNTTYVVLYDYLAQRADEIQLSAGQIVNVLDNNERDWWKVSLLNNSLIQGYFPSSYLGVLYPNERPLQVIQTIQVSNGEICDKLLRGQIVIHTGKQMDSFVTIRTCQGPTDNNNHFIQCPEKYLMEVESS